MGIRQFNSKKWEMWWEAGEKEFPVELEKALHAFEVLFTKPPEVICLKTDSVLVYDGPLEVRYRDNITSKTIFVLCGKDKENGTSTIRT